jgi:hypothetical protein
MMPARMLRCRLRSAWAITGFTRILLATRIADPGRSGLYESNKLRGIDDNVKWADESPFCFLSKGFSE